MDLSYGPEYEAVADANQRKQVKRSAYCRHLPDPATIGSKCSGLERDRVVCGVGYGRIAVSIALLILAFPPFSFDTHYGRRAGGHSIAWAQEPAPKEKGIPSDRELLRYMNQPVERTFDRTDLVYLNAATFNEEVLNAERPVMVLFYSRNGQLSRGLAALARALLNMFPDFKPCAYPLPDAKLLTVDTFKVYHTRYRLRGVPALLFYDKKGDVVEVQGAIHGGYNQIEEVKRQLEKIPKIIRRKIMD
ncbi:MAG: hypothetical protein V3S89_07670 [Desulfobacterales bacterium]